MGISETVCLNWPGTIILPILASQIGRITGISHKYQAPFVIITKKSLVICLTKVKKDLYSEN
jgi:hypothetical protein